MNNSKTVGVLGGIGPAATVEFFRRLVAATPATIDQNHLHTLIDSNPSVPDRTGALLRGRPSSEPALVKMAKGLELAGAELLAVPCNTAHYYLEAIREGVSIPVLDMIAETAARIEEKSVGLLATGGTIRMGLYQRACAARGIDLIVPEGDQQRTVGRAIDAIKASRSHAETELAIEGVVGELQTAGAEAVVAGCTEISLIDGRRMPLRWIDALDCLVDATIHEALVEQ